MWEELFRYGFSFEDAADRSRPLHPPPMSGLLAAEMRGKSREGGGGPDIEYSQSVTFIFWIMTNLDKLARLNVIRE